jgi:dTMP kinase
VHRGRYIVIEGGEGVGKTTQAHLLVDWLIAGGHPAIVVREPGGDAFAEAGRDLLLGSLPREPETEVLLFNALRAQVLRAVVQPSLAAGTWVVADRSRLSTIVYQGHGHGVDLDWTRAVCELTTQLCGPDLELVLQVDEATADARRAARGTTDRFEQLGADFHRRVADGYRQEAVRDGLPVVAGDGSPDEVVAAIVAIIEARLLSGT